MIKQIVLSIIITSIVSAAVAFGVSKFLGFWQAFSLVFVLQLLLFYFINNRSIFKQQLEMERLLNERYDTLSKNVVMFECPCGQNTFEEVIYINGENVFGCPKCNNDIKLNVAMSPTLVTNPVDLEKALQKIRALDEESL